MVVRGATHLGKGFGAAHGHLILPSHFGILTVGLWWWLEGWHLDAAHALRVCETHFRRALTALTLGSAGLLVRIHVHGPGASCNAIFIRAHDWKGGILTLVAWHLSLWLLEAGVNIFGTSSHCMGLTTVGASHHVEDFGEPLSILWTVINFILLTLAIRSLGSLKGSFFHAR